jgi:hypothetical protein
VAVGRRIRIPGSDVRILVHRTRHHERGLLTSEASQVDRAPTGEQWRFFWLRAMFSFEGSWFGADPPGGASDEAAHYIRAAGISQGEWVGAPVLDWEGLTVESSPLSMSWLQVTSRDVDLTANLNPPAWHKCYVFRTWQSATCVAG